MTLAAFALAALTPSVFWLWFFVRKDRYRPAPKRLLALAFIFGGLSTVPAALIEFVLLGDLVTSETALDDASLYELSQAMLLVVGPVEEVCKFLAAWIKPYRSLYFDEPIDALVYAVAAGLGFASVENLFYILEYGPEVMVLRAPITTLGHAAISCVWGYAYGLHQASGYNRPLTVVGALILSAVLHGIFNIFVLTPPLAIFGIGMIVVGGFWTYRRFQWGQIVSPFRLRRNYPTSACSVCQKQIRIVSRFCRFCGAPARFEIATLTCGNCRAVNLPRSIYCTTCGDRLLRA